VPYRLFHGKHFASFGDLLKVLSGETDQLVLPVEGTDRAAAVDRAAGPPAALIEQFWGTFGSRVPANAVVLASAGEVAPRDVRTVVDKALPTGPAPSRAFLFFVDLEPEANWAHACAYVFAAVGKAAIWHEAEWPPHASIELRLLARP
jgi:hypothetical protein